ncbi:hypothetical protein HHK36_011371 [Tetracentron sinense]|uniref:Uncharacterized protein n=1 Tax=Tetracentron sinense TaxID=13715 RepID=A0A834ZCM4_TETSI|nr:hypothetical protein HHK36_011371 [Tetracentron sinense]
MASPVEDCAQGKESKGLIEDIDEDELFEIDLELLNNVPPPTYWENYPTPTGNSFLAMVNKIPQPTYWESFPTATGNALLANCLLPIADVSSAVPMILNSWEILPAAKLLGLSSDGGLGIQHKGMIA